MRGLAKGRFTRICRSIDTAITQSKPIEYVNMLASDLKSACDNVYAKHEEFILHADGEDIEDDEWISTIEQKYDEIRELLMNYKIHTHKDETDASKIQQTQLENEAKQTSMHKARNLRNVHEADLRQLCKGISMFIENESIDAVKTGKRDLKQLMEETKTAHMEYVMMLPSDQFESENAWLLPIRESYNEISEAIGKFLDGHTASPSPAHSEKKAKNGFHLEKMRLPVFDGDIRNYPRFRSDFKKFIQPETTVDQSAFVLRRSLGEKPLQVIGAIDDDISEIWKRLDERYGDPIKMADSIMRDFEKIRPVKDGDDKRLVELVDNVERSYNDLTKVGMEREISNTRVVGDIERRLPPIVRREWSRSLYDDKSEVDRSDRFPALLQFLIKEKKSVEYELSEIRSLTHSNSPRATVNATDVKERSETTRRDVFKKCLIHDDGKHATPECRVFMGKSAQERAQLIKEKGACYCCLNRGHRVSDCRKRRKCGVMNCTRAHHPILHCDYQGAEQTPTSTVNNHTVASSRSNEACLLQLMKIKVGPTHMNVLWDGCATSSLVTNTAAKTAGLRGAPIKVSITKVGGVTEEIDSFRYSVPLTDRQGYVVHILAYGIDRITADIEDINTQSVVGLFMGVGREQIERPRGQVDLLIGFEYAGYHPIRLQAVDHLLVLENRFGRCLGGTHPAIKERTRRILAATAMIHHVATCSLEDFMKLESMGVECKPRCGNCRCGKCPIGSKDYTLKEERELALIDQNLTFHGSHWEAAYPWIKDPANLSDNRRVAFATLKALERRLERDPTKAKVYDAQMKDMIDRGVAREIPKEEMASYKGPIHYIAHHEVLKPDSKSTPVRIVFNSSANYKGHILNDYWAKGPDMMNSLLGVLLRFRENEVALVGDIRKMYHSIFTTLKDQHCHRFLWRGMRTNEDPKTYCMKVVNMGDRPSATIATVALKKTAELGKDQFPKAASTIQQNVYVDDILESVQTLDKARTHAREIDQLIKPGNFILKKWVFSGEGLDTDDEEWPGKESSEKVLGISWNPKRDVFHFITRINFSQKKKKLRQGPDLRGDQIPSEIPSVLTKRMCLSQVNGIYDPLGLVAPFTIKAKILLRKMWGIKLGWDDPIPDDMKREWIQFFKELYEVADISFQRCIKPEGADTETKPTLIVFSDGSEQAFGTVAYIRWLLNNGRYVSNLVASKSRIAPIAIASIVRLELSGAVLNKRLTCFIKKEMRLEFDRELHIVDSEIVRSMIQKQSYGFKTFVATRIGEIQEATEPEDWWWCRGELNVADFITRGKTPSEIGSESVWQQGPTFLQQPIEEWPIEQSCSERNLPERAKVVMVADAREADTLANRIGIHRYSSYDKLLRVTARILAMYNDKAFSSATKVLTAKDIEQAELFWIKECQKPIMKTLNDDKVAFNKLYAKLCPKVRDDDVIVVGARAGRYVHFSYNKQEVPLLVYRHPFSKLYATHVHHRGHPGVQTTVSKIRSKFWIINLFKMAKSIRHHCVPCRRQEKDMVSQKMGQLPLARLKPSPPWNYVGVDLFGPFTTRGEVNKRARGKAYGVIFNCFTTRAVHIDLAVDYSASGFLQVLRRFVSLRGYPSEMYSDGGSQLVGASNELKQAIDGWDADKLHEFGVTDGMTWKFSMADSPWQNGVTEILIKGVKKAINHAIGSQVLQFHELQTVFYEVANLVNERPIGRHPTDPEDGVYLCPNNLLLGRATGRVPSGPWRETNNPRHRVEFIQNIIKAYWIKWTRDYFPSLIIRQKWHHQRRNVQKGDVVLVQDSNAVRGNWRMGIVDEVHPDETGNVRNVQVRLKTADKSDQCRNANYTLIRRAVQRLIVLVPVDRDEID